jgi:hypothetical protein
MYKDNQASELEKLEFKRATALAVGGGEVATMPRKCLTCGLCFNILII